MRSDIQQISDILLGEKISTAVVCVGNELLSDDGAGQLLGKKISNPNVAVLDTGANPENFISKIAAFNAERVIFFDAAHFNKQAGYAAVFNEEDIKNVSFSSHSMPLSAMLKILHMQKPNTKFLCIGVQPKNTQYLQSITPEVEESVTLIAEIINKL